MSRKIYSKLRWITRVRHLGIWELLTEMTRNSRVAKYLLKEKKKMPKWKRAWGCDLQAIFTTQFPQRLG